MTHADHPTKKEMILEIARELSVPRFTPAEVEQIRRQLVARLGAGGKTSADYIAGVLETAGMRIVWSTKADTEGQYEEEFQDLLHFANLEDAEMCIMRLDELYRKFKEEEERAAAERVLEVARMGRRRAEMIAQESQSGTGKARREGRNHAVVQGVARNTRRIFRLAGSAQSVAGFPEAIRQERLGGRVSARWRTCNTYWKWSRSISARTSRR